MEPTGLPFNSRLALEIYNKKRSVNPLVNAGAIAAVSLVKAGSEQERWNLILQNLNDYSGSSLTVLEDVYQSEYTTAFGNRAIANLLYTGTLARYPNIRFIMSHMGGVTPFLLFRLRGLDDQPKLRERIPEGVAAYLGRLYYDIAQSAAPLAFRALLDIADPSRILFGTDYPFARNAEKVMRI